jgi:hypothetical protein
MTSTISISRKRFSSLIVERVMPQWTLPQAAVLAERPAGEADEVRVRQLGQLVG